MSPDAFDAWSRILGATPGGALWLLQNTFATVDNLKKEAGARGVDPSRLVFAERAANAKRLARHQLADIFLDGWPYGAIRPRATRCGRDCRRSRASAKPSRAASRRCMLTDKPTRDIVAQQLAGFAAFARAQARGGGLTPGRGAPRLSPVLSSPRGPR